MAKLPAPQSEKNPSKLILLFCLNSKQSFKHFLHNPKFFWKGAYKVISRYMYSYHRRNEIIFVQYRIQKKICNQLCKLKNHDYF